MVAEALGKSWAHERCWVSWQVVTALGRRLEAQESWRVWGQVVELEEARDGAKMGTEQDI